MENAVAGTNFVDADVGCLVAYSLGSGQGLVASLQVYGDVVRQWDDFLCGVDVVAAGGCLAGDGSLPHDVG